MNGFDVGTVAMRVVRDAGAPSALRGAMHSQALTDACAQPTPPFTALEFELALDGGTELQLDDQSRVELAAYDDAGVRTVLGAARTGSVWLRGLTASSSAGTFDLGLKQTGSDQAVQINAWWKVQTCP